MLKKSVLVIILSLIFSLPILADKAAYVTKQQADLAITALNITKRIRHFCAPCKGDTPRDETYTTAVVAKADDPKLAHLWMVLVNNNSIDIAYVYFPVTDGRWQNLAAYVGLRYNDVPEFLPGQTGSATTPPVNNPPPPPNTSTLTSPDWMPVIEMDKQIFPALFLATATQNFVNSEVPSVIGDAQGKIGIHIINPNANTSLKIGVEIDSILKYQEMDAMLTEKGKYYQIYPKLVWNWEALKRFKKPSPANATFSLYLNGKLIEKRNVVVRIRTINDAVYAYSYLVDENRWASTKWLFAAYVNEDHEWIDPLLKEALDSRIVSAFAGYQQQDYKKVVLQAFAVWYVLQKRGFKYSSITDTSGDAANKNVYSQFVRLFDDAVKTSQANCVDGTVLIASVLKKIGIRVALVLVPGHCL